MRRVAVTGATGFIGRHLVRRLVDAGMAVTALSRRDDPDLSTIGAVVVKGTLEEPRALVSLVQDADVVVHAAGAIRARSPKHFAATNAEATARLASLVADAARKPAFLLISSLAARKPEISAYAASKRAAEAALESMVGDLRWTVVRPPAVYGPGDRATLPLFRAMKRGFIPVPGDGRGRLSLIHVDDLADAIFELLSNPVADKQILGIRDDRADGYCWLDLLRAGEEAFGRSIRPLRLPLPLMWLTAAASGTICKLIGSSPTITLGKVREIFHRDWVCRDNPIATQTSWRPRIGLQTGFRMTADWYEENGWI